MELGPILRAIGKNRVRFGLIAFEIALTLAIAANCVNLIQETRKEIGRPSGFDDANLLRVESRPFDKAYEKEPFLDESVRKDVALLRGLPGVSAASNTRFLPWQGGGSSTELKPLGSKGPALRTQIYNADDGTLATLKVSIVAGRDVKPGEARSEFDRLQTLLSNARPRSADGRPVDKVMQPIVVSEAFAKLAFPGMPAVGQRLEDGDGDLYEIVGVFDRFYNPYGWPIHEYAVFFPYPSRSFAGGSRYLVRAEPGQRDAVRAEIEKRLLADAPGRTVEIRAVVDVKDQYFVGKNLLVDVLLGVIVLLVLVTGLGIVGVTSFSVTERTRQIGTRRALGAQREDVVRYFLVENWLVTTVGLTLGSVLAVALNVLLVEHGLSTRIDASLVLGGILALWTLGLLAALFPALRAAKVAPAVATRNV